MERLSAALQGEAEGHHATAKDSQKKLADAEINVRRLSAALQGEAEDRHATAVDAQQRLAYVETLAYQELAKAQEIIASGAVERHALAERAEQAVCDARLVAQNAEQRHRIAEAEAYQSNEWLKAEASNEVQNVIHVQSLKAAAAKRDDRVEIEAYVQGVETGKQEFKATIERELHERHQREIHELKSMANDTHLREVESLRRKAKE